MSSTETDDPGGRLARRRRAEEIARKHDVDAGDVEHVLFNMTLSPIEKLRQSFRRARLRGLAIHFEVPPLEDTGGSQYRI